MTSFRRVDVLATAAIALSALMFGLEISSVPVALPLVQADLGATVASLQWIVTAYTIASVAVLVAAGVLADRTGRKRVLGVSIASFGVASLVCGAAPSLAWIIAGRAVQGAAGGAMMICGLAILSHRFPEGPARARAFGLWGVGFGLGLGTGPTTGLALLLVGGWRAVFLVHVLLAVVAGVLVVRTVTDSRDPAPSRLDLAGTVTLAAALVAVVFVVGEGPRVGFGSPLALAGVVVALVAGAGFVVAERHAQSPIIPGDLLRSRRLRGALVGSVAMNVSFWPMVVFVPLFVEHGLGQSSVTASGVLLAFTLPTFVLPPVAERLALRWGPERAIPCGLTVLGFGLALVAVAVAGPWPSWLTLLPGGVVSGTGLALTNTPVTNTATGAVPASRAGTASAVDLSVRFLTLSVTVAAMATLVGTGASQGGFARAVALAAVGVFLLAGTCRFVFSRPRGRASNRPRRTPPRTRSTTSTGDFAGPPGRHGR